MAFLKVITSIAAAILLLIFLNNLMDKLFPGNGYISKYTEAYKKCESLQPNYNQTENASNPDTLKQSEKTYQKCVDEQTQKANDEAALRNQTLWMRSIIVLILLIVVAILLFKRFPFFSSALIGGGLLFAISYPLFAQYGSFLGSSADLSDTVQQRVSLMKMFTSLVGFAGLTLADVFFFEKHSEAPPTPPTPPQTMIQ